MFFFVYLVAVVVKRFWPSSEPFNPCVKNIFTGRRGENIKSINHEGHEGKERLLIKALL